MGERTALYRVFDDVDTLLYIGISKRFGRRWTEHAEVQPWWLETRRQTIYWYESREEAEAAETAAIKAEQPKFNIIHAGEARRAVSSAWLNEPGGLTWDLHRMRTGARLTGSELAAALGWQRTKISKLENGKRVPAADEISAWAAACGRPEAAARLIGMLSEHRSDGSHGASMAGLLRHALAIRSVGATIIPDLLMTADYARHRAARTEAAVAAAMHAQAVLYERGREMEFIIAEAALCLLPCPPRAMLGQVDRLMALAGLDGITLGIVPFGTELAVAPRFNFTILDGTAFLKTHTEDQVLDAHESAAYSKIADGLMAEAATGDDARLILAAAAARLRA